MHIAYDQVAPEQITYYSLLPKAAIWAANAEIDGHTQGLPRAAISGAIPPVARKRTLAALQKIGKLGSLPPFAAQSTKVGNGPEAAIAPIAPKVGFVRRFQPVDATL